MKAPDYYQPIMPYLVVKDAERFIDFLKDVFDADIRLIVPREDGTVMHAEAVIDKGTIMFANANENYHHSLQVCLFFLHGQLHFMIRRLLMEQNQYKNPTEESMA